MKNYHRTIVHLLRCRGHSSDTNQSVNKFSRCNENDITFVTGKEFHIIYMRYFIFCVSYCLAYLFFCCSLYQLCVAGTPLLKKYVHLKTGVIFDKGY